MTSYETHPCQQKGALPRASVLSIPLLCVRARAFEERREEGSSVSEGVCDGKELSARSLLTGEEREPRSLSGCEANKEEKEENHEPGRVPRSGFNGLPQ